MEKHRTFNKAWLKLSYKEDTYLPVIIVQRASQFRSLIVDDIDGREDIDLSLAYYAEDAALLPRSGQSFFSDLL